MLITLAAHHRTSNLKVACSHGRARGRGASAPWYVAADDALDEGHRDAGIAITGYSSETLDGAALRAATAEIFARLARGELAPPAYQTMPLSNAAEAHRLLEARGVNGRILLVPDRDA